MTPSPFFFPQDPGSSWILGPPGPIIIFNSFSERLPISTSFSYFSGILCYSFIWVIVLCTFISINFLWLWFSFWKLQDCSSSCLFCLPSGGWGWWEGLLFGCSVESWLFVTPWTAAGQASLSCTLSHSLLKLMSIKSVMPSNHLILCHALLLPPSIFPSDRVFSNESAFCIRWPKYWSFSFTISLGAGENWNLFWWAGSHSVNFNPIIYW